MGGGRNVVASLEGFRDGVLVADGSEQVEVTAPREALREAGASVQVLSPDGSDVRGYHYLEPGDVIPVDGRIGDVGVTSLDALVLPGGLGGPDTLRNDEAAVALVSKMTAGGTPIGVICHGPWLLIDADALKGRTLTCVPQLRTDVVNAGAVYRDEAVHVDRDATPVLISSRDHNTARDFAEAIVREFAATRPHVR